MMQETLDSRRNILDLLNRAFVGPTCPENSGWLGNDERSNVLEDGATYPSDDGYLQGPWFSKSGEEILPDRYAPIKLYGIAVLFPEISNSFSQNQMSLFENTEDPDEEMTSDNSNILEEIDATTNPDDSDVPAESTYRPRSIAVSFRVPIGIQQLSIKISGGVYRPISIMRGGISEPWWERESVEKLVTLQTQNSSQKMILNNIELQVGIECRDQNDKTQICTVWLRNDSKSNSLESLSEYCLFQTNLEVSLKDLLEYQMSDESTPDSLALLYSSRKRRSIGHGCDSKELFQKEDNFWKVQSVSLPITEVSPISPDITDNDSPYSLSMLGIGSWDPKALSEIDRLILNYDSWIGSLKTKIEDLDPRFRDIAQNHLEQCINFHERIVVGWELVKSTPAIKSTFMDASRAMANQRTASSFPTRKISLDDNEKVVIERSEPNHAQESLQSEWRPFQIAFILANIPNAINDKLPDTHPVDVIWMPTGGGKTEAYLGLAAFTILWERRIAPSIDSDLSNKSFTKVVMRYTLRLLTAQQVFRAASLICALEILRRENELVYGTRPVRIGAWLGSASTPNTRESAIKKYNDVFKSSSILSGLLLTKCPWCATQLGIVLGEKEKKIAGYRKVPVPWDSKEFRLKSMCENINCAFHDELPIFEVDEDIYHSPPDFLIGTVDKFARLAWVVSTKDSSGTRSAQRIFGLTKGERTLPPPKLFIQDELHLITGPLGSIDGLYEPVFESLCRLNGKYQGRSPLFIASTATTKNFGTQLHALYGRKGQLVPPPGLTIENSFFAREDQAKPGKIYIGICPGGNSGFLKNQGKVMAVLGHAAAVLRNNRKVSDPWWTNIAFFSSRRSLGQLDSLVETDIKSAFYQLRVLSGVSSGQLSEDGKQVGSRNMQKKRQLTAISSDDVGAVLEELSINNQDTNSIDICFSTSMIEVGLDVPRLGLMTIIGQPKSSSQYIQVSGRVGRSSSAPGLIVSILNPNVYRDRSHFENFLDWHQRLYASVEPASVTPFTKRALHRTLASVLTVLLRTLSNSAKVKDSISTHWKYSLDVLMKRASLINNKAVTNLNEVADDLMFKANALANQTIDWESSNKNDQFIFDPSDPLDRDKERIVWRVLNSMRAVDSDAGLQFSSELYGRPLGKRFKTEAENEVSEL